MGKPLKQLLLGEWSLLRLVKSLLFIYAALLIYAYFFTDGLIFRPQPSSYTDNRDSLKLPSDAQTQITALYLPNPRATYTILYSHGNAEDLGEIRPILEALRQQGFAVLAYDYRGYGTSQGRPSEASAYADINAAYRYLTETLRLSPQRILIYGRSVGGGPAVDLASRQPAAGLILQSTFISAFRVVTTIPVVPFDKFDNLGKIHRVRCPVLIMHGRLDEVVPFWHGEKLFEAANQPKQFYWIDQAGHNDLNEVAGLGLMQAIKTFTDSLRAIQVKQEEPPNAG